MADQDIKISNCVVEEIPLNNPDDLTVSTGPEETYHSTPSTGRRGLIFAFLCSCFMVGQTISIAFLAGKVNSNEIMSIRYFVMSSCCIALNIYKRVPLLPASNQELKFLVIRSVLGAMSISCAYYAFHHMRAADATAIYNASPVVTLFLSCVFLKEGFDCLNAILAILAVLGVVFIAKPSFIFPAERSSEDEKSELFAAFVALAGCVFSSLVSVYIRLYAMKVSFSKSTMYYATISLSLSLIMTTALSHWKIPSCGLDRYLLVGIGFMSFISECLYAASLAHASAVYVSMMLTNEIMMVFILETLLLKVPLSLLSIVGILLIVGTSLTVSIKSVFPADNLRRCSTATRTKQPNEEEACSK